MTTPIPVYDRAPSRKLQELLSPGGFLAPLVELAGQQVSGYYHDVQLRTNDEVHVYRGHTRLVTAKRVPDGGLNLTAHSAYTKQPCAGDVLRKWRSDEPGFDEALYRYLSEVKVNSSFTLGEAKIQEQWSLVREPWIQFDREGVLGGSHNKGADFPAITDAKSELDILARSKGWPLTKATGMSIDQLAIDPQGRLVLLELKDASKTTVEVYYSPFQLLQYVWEWYAALESVRNGLQAVIDARVAVGLTPPSVPPLSGSIRAAVGFGPDLRSSEVKRRYGMVLEIVNRHLPDGVEPIETWACTDTGASLVV